MKDIIIDELMKISNEEKAILLQRFFKTGKGEYGENDKFLGINSPNIRKIAKQYYKDTDLKDMDILLHNKYHDIRLTALIMLTYKMKKASIDDQERIVDLYLKNTEYINNWDLVDLSAPLILGYYLYNNKLNRDILYELVNKEDLWSKRIAILSTLYFIKNNDYKDTLEISYILLNHKHDLIHKAVGWMLREVGKKDHKIEYEFLKKYYKNMPRTMLRYAIEKFDEDTRQKFLTNKI